jgi:hypothetical protein
MLRIWIARPLKVQSSGRRMMTGRDGQHQHQHQRQRQQQRQHQHQSKPPAISEPAAGAVQRHWQHLPTLLLLSCATATPSSPFPQLCPLTPHHHAPADMPKQRRLRSSRRRIKSDTCRPVPLPPAHNSPLPTPPPPTHFQTRNPFPICCQHRYCGHRLRRIRRQRAAGGPLGVELRGQQVVRPALAALCCCDISRRFELPNSFVGDSRRCELRNAARTCRS